MTKPINHEILVSLQEAMAVVCLAVATVAHPVVEATVVAHQVAMEEVPLVSIQLIQTS